MMKNVIICAFLFLLVFALSAPVVAKPAGDTGFYEVRSNVENASVSLDGVYAGNILDGMLRIAVPAGNRPVNRELRIEAAGYEPYRETVVKAPKAGEIVVLRGTLRSLPVTRTGTIRLAVTPPGGNVSIDGVDKGSVSPSGILVLRGLSTGNQILHIEREGYENLTKRIYVEPNVDTQMRFTLVPLTHGSLMITSQPEGAQISLNGEITGITPLSIPYLAEGPYQVRLLLTGHQVWNGFVSVVPGQNAELNAVLVPETVPDGPAPEETSPLPTQAASLLPVTILSALAGTLLLIQKRE